MGENVDVLVVGAGPAGSAAAITAADAGCSVILCDKAVFPRDKTCGDGLTTEALRLLETLGLEPESVASWTPVHDVVLRSPSGRVVELALPGDGLYAAVAPRSALDAGLFALAGTRGAALRPGAALDALEQSAGGVTARLSDGTTVVARWVVAADGVYSTVRRLAVAPPTTYLGEWHAFRQYWAGVADDRRLWVLFEEDLLPGYAWVFPLGAGRANVGFGIPRRPGVSVRPMAGIWRDLPRREALRRVLGPSAQPEGTHRAWPIPADLARAPLATGRVLFAGDAAGATDPLTGEGIAQALTTGIAAARAVVGGGDVAGRYTRVVKGSLGPDLRFSAVLGRILASPRGARGAIHAAGLNPWTRRHFARWLFEDYPRAMLFTPGRWHRGALHEPGAYRG
ncbi:MAG: NAD(P)/FAD-dependent oxidoreductase [Acidimicrobiia bacterium]